ncbi:MAG: aminotransferase class V-fold PLP-dependent enzyme [Myxococcota bacterium]|nr:aminotransferase class V-fold PLP-dependent enzyme [Myxococcota bacterium]
MPHYLDYNATAPLLPVAREAMVAALSAANTASMHAAGQSAAMIVDAARMTVGRLLSRDPRQVSFTSGATEANATILRGLKTPSRPAVLTSAIEHPSVLHHATHTIPVLPDGVIDLDVFRQQVKALSGELAVISVMGANNETGVLQPVAAIAEIAAEAGIPFHCDATQLIGRLPCDVPADWMTISAHKFGGPMGVGALVGEGELPPLLLGGPQERGRRAGTHNVPGIAGMGAAAEAAGRVSPDGRDALEACCVALGGEVLGRNAPRLPNTLSVLFPVPGDLIVMALDLAGVYASNGSACSSGGAQESHVVQAMGRRGIPVRLSLGETSDVDAVLPILEKVVQQCSVSF